MYPNIYLLNKSCLSSIVQSTYQLSHRVRWMTKELEGEICSYMAQHATRGQHDSWMFISAQQPVAAMLCKYLAGIRHGDAQCSAADTCPGCGSSRKHDRPICDDDKHPAWPICHGHHRPRLLFHSCVRAGLVLVQPLRPRS